MSKMGRPSVWAEHRDEMVRLYTDEKWSRGQIALHFKTSTVTVTRQLDAAGVEFAGRVGINPNDSRTPEKRAEIAAKISANRKGKGTGARVERETRTCQKCEKEYAYIPGRSGERFCSRACSVSATVGDHTKLVHEAYAENPKQCQCGESIPYEYRNTRQFCSPECRSKYGAKRQADPANQVTFICQNCGESVTKPRSWGKGYFKYCSNACASRHTKTKQHIVVEDSVVLDSKWEALFWGLTGFLKIPCDRTNRTEGVMWDGPDSWYAPDFYLPTIDVHVEVKGQEDPEDTVKWQAFRATGHRLLVVNQNLMDRMRRAGQEEFLSLARIYAM